MFDVQDREFGSLGELFDGPHATPERVQVGPYFLNIASLADGRLDLTQSDHVSNEQFVRWTRRVTPEEGDLLFSYETRLGEAALMHPNVQACLGRRMALLRPNRAVVHPQFLLYYYLGPDFQALIRRNTIHGATVNRIGLKTMGTWTVRVPPLNAQQAIAEVLGALDDKIAANAKTASLARQLSGLFFELAMRDSVDTELIGSIMTLEYGRALPADKRNSGDVAVYGSGGLVGTHSQWLVEGPAVVVGRKGTAGSVHWSPGLTFPIDTTYYVVPNSDRVSLSYCYFALLGAGLADRNSDSAVPGLNRSDAYAIPVRVPSPTSMAHTSARAEVLLGMADQADAESRTLSATRDALLPALMSGKLRVKDLETQVEGVL